MDSARSVTTAQPGASPDELARAWLVGLIEREPLHEIAGLDLALLIAEAPALIAAILEGLDPEQRRQAELPADAHRRARPLSRLRRGDRATAEIPRDLAVLQSVLISSLHHDAWRRPRADVERDVQRLAEIFGLLQGAVTQELALAAARGERGDEDHVELLPGSADLDHWLEVLVAQYRRYGNPFALALVDIEGLGRINEAYGRRSGDWMSTALASVIRNQIRIVDHAFRLGENEFCVLAPNVSAPRLRPMADRLARVVEASQSAEGPRVAISVGVSACPEHGHEKDRLLETAAGALDAARATGQPVEVATSNGHRAVRDG